MPDSAPAFDPTPAGWPTSLRAGLTAGLLAGGVFGLLDGVIAGLRTDILGALNWLGCLGAAVVVYGLFWVPVMLAAALVAHPWLRRHDLPARVRALASVALGVGLFFEFYWWSRERVLAGVSATDPRRIAASLAFLALALLVGRVLVVLCRRLPERLLWAAAALIPIAWLAGLTFLVQQSAVGKARGRVDELTRERPNVLLVVVDALRQDVLGCYGHPRVKTPVFDALAERGVLFENAWVQAPFTWTSFGSILTGKYPRRHGLMKMVPGVRMAPNITLPFHLKSARFAGASGALGPDSYVGAAFMTGTLSHGSGLLRGFDVYFEALVGHDLVDLDSAWSVFRSELVLQLLRTKLDGKLQHYRNQDPVATRAKSWFAQNGRRRFVSMVHFYSTHTPYDPQPHFRDMYVDPAYKGPVHAFYSEYRAAIEAGDFRPTPADVKQITNLYYAGVTQADAMLGQILDELEAQGVLDETLVIVTADHGEELGDHGLWEHNYMFETNLRVPLIMALPGRLPAGVRSEALVESIDIVPTACALLGLVPPHEEGLLDERGLNRGSIDGHDLTALVRGQSDGVREHSFAENGAYMAVRDRRFKLVVGSAALSGEDWRVSPAPGIAAAQLYDLQEDPLELVNALETHPEHEQAERLLAVLRAWDERMPVPRSDVMVSDRDIENAEKAMKLLGYGLGVNSELEDEKQKKDEHDPVQR
jgi:arylsulfatase A-like enzyme